MSLLDDVSIVVTPNGYKAGELYAVIPVPTEGAEEVTNGDFATDTDWTKPTGATISGGLLNLSGVASGQNTSQSTSIVIGKRYKITFTISNYVQGGVKPIIGSTGGLNSVNSNGTFTQYGIASGNSTIYLQADGITTLSVDNVSVKEYTSADMDVTRATAATRVDENGLVNYAEIIGGEELSGTDFPSPNTAWTVYGSSTPDPVFGNGVLLYNGNKIYQSILSNSTTYIINYEVSANVGSGQLRYYNGNGYVNIDSSIGEHTLYFTTTASIGNIGFYFNVSSGTSVTVLSASVKEVTRDNVPRIDYTGGGCPHILAEPQRTNVIPYSSDFTDSSWTKSSVTITPNSIISPDGSLNASLMTISGGVSDQRIHSNISYSGTNTISIFAKASDSNWLAIRIGSSVNKWYDLENGVLGGSTITTAYVDADIQDFGNGWYRCILVFTDNATTNTRIYPAEGNLDVTHTSGSVCIWGCQAESTSSYATSYIPTNGEAGGVTRNQDIFTRDGIGSLINSTEGVLFLEVAALADDGTNRYISISNSTLPYDNYLYFRFMSTSNRVLARARVGGITINTMEKTISDTTAFNKFAIKWKSGDYAFWINGVEELVDTSSPVFAANTLNEIEFSFPAAGGGGFPSKVKQLQVYDTALTDEQLLQLTGESGTDFYESYAEMASALTYTIQ